MPDVKLRPFLQSDLDVVRELILSTIDACYSGVYPPRTIEFFKQYHSDENILDRAEKGHTIISESEGKVIATGTIIENHICAVFVLCFIQHRGLGRMIMQALEDRALSAGFTEITLEVSLPSRVLRATWLPIDRCFT